MSIEFINDQCHTSFCQAERSIEIRAKDRVVVVADLGSGVVAIKVHRFSLEPNIFYMTEKAWVMLSEAVAKFNDLPMVYGTELYAEVIEDWFEGDFMKPAEQMT